MLASEPDAIGSALSERNLDIRRGVQGHAGNMLIAATGATLRELNRTRIISLGIGPIRTFLLLDLHG